MNVIFVLIAVSLLVAIGFLISFIWSIRAGQYEDEYTPSVRILFDDEKNVMEDENSVDSQQLANDSQQPAVGSQQSAVSSQQPKSMTSDQ